MYGTHEAFELFKNLGGDSFSIASVFLMSGLFPSLLMAFPNYSTCLQADSHVSNDTARFSASSFSKTVGSFFDVIQLILSLLLICHPDTRANYIIFELIYPTRFANMHIANLTLRRAFAVTGLILPLVRCCPKLAQYSAFGICSYEYICLFFLESKASLTV